MMLCAWWVCDSRHGAEVSRPAVPIRAEVVEEDADTSSDMSGPCE